MAITIQYFYRHPKAGFNSIEMLFNTIENHLPSDFNPSRAILPRTGASIISLSKNLLYASGKHKQLNHITGDVNYIAIALPAKNTLITIHDIDSLLRFQNFKNWLLKLIWLRLPVKRVRMLTVISEATKRELLKYMSTDVSKIYVIPNPVSPEFTYSPKPFNSATPRILHLGTKENKNLERLIPALIGISCHLRIIGRLTQEQQKLLADHKLEYSTASALTYQQIVEEYRQADLITFVSLYEGFGMPIVEAQATGRPVITSNCSSMPEVAGEGALLVDPTSITEIREGIIKLIKDEGLRKHLIQKGLENVKRFDVKVIAEQYAALYRQIAEENT